MPRVRVYSAMILAAMLLAAAGTSIPAGEGAGAAGWLAMLDLARLGYRSSRVFDVRISGGQLIVCASTVSQGPNVILAASFDMESGELLWSRQIRYEFQGMPLECVYRSEGILLILVGSYTDSYIMSIDVDSGSLRVLRLPGLIFSRMAEFAGVVVAAGRNSEGLGAIATINPGLTNISAWIIDFGRRDLMPVGMGLADSVVVVGYGYTGGVVLGFDPRSGGVAWAFQLPVRSSERFMDIAVHGDAIVSLVSKEDGGSLTRFESGSNTTIVPRVTLGLDGYSGQRLETGGDRIYALFAAAKDEEYSYILVEIDEDLEITGVIRTSPYPATLVMRHGDWIIIAGQSKRLQGYTQGLVPYVAVVKAPPSGAAYYRDGSGKIGLVVELLGQLSVNATRTTAILKRLEPRVSRVAGLEARQYSLESQEAEELITVYRLTASIEVAETTTTPTETTTSTTTTSQTGPEAPRWTKWLFAAVLVAGAATLLAVLRRRG